ncbi:MAG: hypothetical protein ACI8W7_000801 [Gammaproteobacteria bacterium]|jgi:hypothetical protein
MRIDIDTLTEAELVDLNHRIVERLRFIAQMKAHGAMMRFSVGQRVAFDSSNGQTCYGVLVKYNKKTVTVVTDDGQRWNVAPTFLRKAEPIDITPRRDNATLLEQ